MFFSKPFRASLFALAVILNIIFASFYNSVLSSVFSKDSVVYLAVLYFILYAVPLILYFALTGENAKYVFKITPIGIGNIIVIICISIFIQPLLMFISTLSSVVFGSETTQYLKGFANAPIFYTFLSTAIFPAVFEELCYRGVVFSNMREKSISKACIFTGLIFGISHLNGEQFFYAFFMGVVFCVMVYKTGSVFASMLSHFTINFSQTALALYSAKNTIYDSAQSFSVKDRIFISAVPALYMLVPLIFMFALFLYINRPLESDGIIIETEEAIDFSENNDRLITAPFIILVIIFIFSLFS